MLVVTLPEIVVVCGCGHIWSKYLRTAIGWAWSTSDPFGVFAECSIRGGPITVANACADILFRSEADTTNDKWSSKNTRVAYNYRIQKKYIIMIGIFLITNNLMWHTRLALGKQSKILNINLAFPSGSSGKHTPKNNFTFVIICVNYWFLSHDRKKRKTSIYMYLIEGENVTNFYDFN